MKHLLIAAAMTLAATVTGTAGASVTSPAPQPTNGGSPSGPGCAAIEGSLKDIADKPVGTALTQVPELSTLAKAVEEAGLTEKLNSAEDITVFAPTNEAFQAVPKEQLDQLMANKEELTKVLQYHVVQGKHMAADLEGAPLTTLQGGDLTAKASGEEITVNDAKVVCADVPTRNATVQVIDKVLMPQ
ncbi:MULTISPECIES: fasciclin domain-containing protein [Nonomuraea]|uniref:Fasciclin domain-containing protein n=1 Tax=Nonomuraea harbinensis TaxID=1286938 RepID=A0ABW1BL72_9ACTN|nr:MULTISPECIES: fasciclin domain-containing protein [Nonomuraea]TXK34209.1 fasciclin domain-containing protein [Nonomuraea sp. C10]